MNDHVNNSFGMKRKQNWENNVYLWGTGEHSIWFGGTEEQDKNNFGNRSFYFRGIREQRHIFLGNKGTSTRPGRASYGLTFILY